MMDFSWLAKGVDPIQLPDPAQSYATMMKLSDLARSNREGAIKERQLADDEVARQEAREIFARAQEPDVGFEKAILEAVQQGKTRGAPLAVKAWKEQQQIENDAMMKKAQADKYSADAEKDRTSTRRASMEPVVNNAAFLARNPNVSQEQIQALVRDAIKADPSAVPTDVDFGDMNAAKAWLQQFGSRDYKAHEQTQDINTAARDAATAAHHTEQNRLTGARDSAHAGYQNRMATVAEARAAAGAGGVGDLNDPDYKKAVDFYADMAIRGDQTWRVGLGRRAGGAQLILDVDKRIPALAAERGMGPGEIMGTRADQKAFGGAYAANAKDETKIAPFVRMFDRNAAVINDLAEKVAKTDVNLLNQPLNVVMNRLASDPTTAEYLAQLRIVQSEAARVLANNTGVLSDSARHEMQEVINGNMTIAQSKAVVARLMQDSHNRIDELRAEGERRRGQIVGGNGQANGPAGTRPTTASPTTSNNRPNQGGGSFPATVRGQTFYFPSAQKAREFEEAAAKR